MSGRERLSWQQVRDEIHDAILSGQYAPGDRLPRDVDIAERLSCARSTVQRAMQNLSDTGLIERRRKGGTRVRPDPVTRATVEIPVVRREIEQKGARYGYQLIRRTETIPPPSVLGLCEIPSAQEMLRVEALHLADGRPFMLEDRWISLQTVPEIRDVDLTAESANEWLVVHRPYSRCDLRFYAQSAAEETAALLDAPLGSALMVIERTTWIDNAAITTVKATASPGYQVLSLS